MEFISLLEGQKSFDFGLLRERGLPNRHKSIQRELDSADMKDLTDVIHEFGPLTFVRDSHSILIHNKHALWLIMGKGQKCPKTRLLSTYQGNFA